MLRSLVLVALLATAAAPPTARGDAGPGPIDVTLAGDRLRARLDRAPLPAVLDALGRAAAIDVARVVRPAAPPAERDVVAERVEAGLRARLERDLLADDANERERARERLAAIADRP